MQKYDRRPADDDPRDGRAGRSACSTPSRSTSRARASTTPTTAPSAAPASSSSRPRTAPTSTTRKTADEGADGAGRQPTARAPSRRQGRRRAAKKPLTRGSAAEEAPRPRLLRSASETVSPAPPSGSVATPSGLQHARRRVAGRRDRAEQPEQRRAAHVGRDRLRRAQAIHGRRTKPPGESTRLFIAARIFCWRRARVRSFSRGLQSFLRVRASASACLPLMCVVPGLQPQRVAAVAEAAVDPRDDAAALVVDAAHRVDQLREVLEVDLDDVVDLDAEVLLDRLDRRAPRRRARRRR